MSTSDEVTEITDAEIVALRDEREKLGLDPAGPNGNGRSIAERAGELPEPDPYADEPEELFVLEQGRRVPISQLIRRGTEVQYELNLRSKSISGGSEMGLIPFNDPHITLVVPCRAGKVEVDPTYNDDGDVKYVKVRANFKPLTVHDLASAQGRSLVGLEEA